MSDYIVIGNGITHLEAWHRAQDGMAHDVQKMLWKLTKNTGTAVSLFIGGPEPREGGEIMTLQ